jgi:hypothetical protein
MAVTIADGFDAKGPLDYYLYFDENRVPAWELHHTVIGIHNPSGGAFPVGTIKRGDTWFMTVPGTLPAPIGAVTTDGVLTAYVDDPDDYGWVYTPPTEDKKLYLYVELDRETGKVLYGVDDKPPVYAETIPNTIYNQWWYPTKHMTAGNYAIASNDYSVANPRLYLLETKYDNAFFGANTLNLQAIASPIYAALGIHIRWDTDAKALNGTWSETFEDKIGVDKYNKSAEVLFRVVTPGAGGGDWAAGDIFTAADLVWNRNYSDGVTATNDRSALTVRQLDRSTIVSFRAEFNERVLVSYDGSDLETIDTVNVGIRVKRTF